MAGVPLTVRPDKQLHVTMVGLHNLEETEPVSLFVTVDDKKILVGHLSSEKIPQLSFKLVFGKEVELSHDAKTSVFFCGYQIGSQQETVSDDEEDNELAHHTNADNVQLSHDKKALASPQPVKGNKAEIESDDSEGSEEVVASPFKSKPPDSSESDDSPPDEYFDTCLQRKLGRGVVKKRKTELYQYDMKQKGKKPAAAGKNKFLCCSICQRSFRGVNDLNNHTKMMHHGLLKFDCSRCGNSFNSQTALTRHRIDKCGGIKSGCKKRRR